MANNSAPRDSKESGPEFGLCPVCCRIGPVHKQHLSYEPEITRAVCSEDHISYLTPWERRSGLLPYGNNHHVDDYGAKLIRTAQYYTLLFQRYGNSYLAEKNRVTDAIMADLRGRNSEQRLKPRYAARLSVPDIDVLYEIHTVFSLLHDMAVVMVSRRVGPEAELVTAAYFSDAVTQNTRDYLKYSESAESVPAGIEAFLTVTDGMADLAREINKREQARMTAKFRELVNTCLMPHALGFLRYVNEPAREMIYE